MKITTACLRYIVPFTVEDFAYAAEQMDSQKKSLPKGEICLWERNTANVRQESDLYAYIRREFTFPEDNQQSAEDAAKEMKTKIGFSWNRSRSQAEGTQKGLKRLQYRSNDLTRVLYDVDISDAGIYLFRNRLGFFWYELTLKRAGSGWQKKSGNIAASDMVTFQYLAKELNRGGIAYFWETDWSRRQILPFSFGQWVAQELAFLKPVFLPDRTNVYYSLWKGTMKKVQEKGIDLSASGANKGKPQGTSEKALQAGEETLSAWTYPENGITRVPDKALLFSYYQLEREEEETDDIEKERYRLAYFLTNGHKSSYGFSEQQKKQMICPAENLIWYATQQGSCVLAVPNEENHTFFSQTFIHRFRLDYFTLYMKCLFQSYSLLLFGQHIQETLSCEPADYLGEEEDAASGQAGPGTVAAGSGITWQGGSGTAGAGSGRTGQAGAYSDNAGQAGDGSDRAGQVSRLTSLICEISLFLSKSMATSVSHLDQQNRYYLYLKEQLHIEEDVRSITAGLSALDNLQKERRRVTEEQRWREDWKAQQLREKQEHQRDLEEKERDEKVETILSLVSLLAIASALVDCYDFISKFFPGTDNVRDIQVPSLAFAVYAISLLMIAAVGVFAVLTIVRNFRERKQNS